MYNLLEYSSRYSDTTGSLWYYSKGEATDFNDDIANTNDFKYFKWKAKLLESIETDGANGIIGNATIAFPLKYLSNFFRLFEIPFINCKVELKLKWMNHCVFSGNDNDNDNANSNNIIFTIKDKNYMFFSLL